MQNNFTPEFVLAPYCEVRYFKHSIHVAFGSAGLVFDNPQEFSAVRTVLSDHISKRPQKHYSSGSLEDKIFKQMVLKNILVPSSFVPEYGRYHRDELYFLLSGADPHEVRKKLSISTVNIVGCGGIGSLLAVKLATMGVGRLNLLDQDTVEVHNITRQLFFSEDDVGRSKVDILKHEIEKRNSNTKVNAINRYVNFDDVDPGIPSADLSILSADQPGIIPQANRYFVANMQPFLHICYVNDIAVWGPFVEPGYTGCWECQSHIGTDDIPSEPQLESLLKEINKNYTCPILSPVSSIAISLACIDIVRFLGQFGEVKSRNNRIGLWTHDLHFETQRFERNPQCQICKEVRSGAT